MIFIISFICICIFYLSSIDFTLDWLWSIKQDNKLDDKLNDELDNKPKLEFVYDF